MFKYTFLTVLVVSLLAVVLGMYLSSDIDKSQVLGFPWQIKNLPDGSTSVFQINIGKTTLAQTEKLFQETAEISLFKAKEKDAVVEAYFNKVLIGGLSSKIVVSFSVKKSQLMSMYNKGARISTLGSGTRRVTLNSNDQILIRQAIITGITYLPSINLNAELIEKRFGQPEQKVIDQKSQAVHWLYPRIGVDVVLHNKKKEVISYVNPADFSKKIVAELFKQK